MGVYLFLANGFEETEAIATVDVLRRGGVEVELISISGKLAVEGAHHITVMADNLFEQVDFNNAKMLILPGGMPGAKNLSEHAGLTKLLLNQNKKGGYIAAICAAPYVLGKMHLLRNQTAVVYPGFEEYLSEAYLSKDSVVISGNIITARGPAFAPEFGLTLLGLLKDDIASAQVSQAMLFTDPD